MKNKVLGLSLAAVLILTTGCSNEKKLHCTLKQGEEGAITTSIMDITFEGAKAKDITLNISIDYNDDYASYANTFKETLESQRSTLEDVGYDVEIISEDNSQKLKATGTADTLDTSEATGTYEATKESLEDSGYTCE